MVLIKEYLDAGELELVLDDIANCSTDIYVVLPHRDMPEKVRAAVNFLTDQVRQQFPNTTVGEMRHESSAA